MHSLDLKERPLKKEPRLVRWVKVEHLHACQLGQEDQVQLDEVQAGNVGCGVSCRLANGDHSCLGQATSRMQSMQHQHSSLTRCYLSRARMPA